MGYGVLRVVGNKAQMMAMGVIDMRHQSDPYLRLGTIFDRVTGIIEEYLPELQGMLFKELGNQGNVSKYRRELQRVYVYSLSKFFNGNKTGLGTDATAYVLHSLQELQKKLQTATHQSGIDTITKAHYTQLADEINRTLTVR